MRDIATPINIVLVRADDFLFASVLDSIPTLAPYWNVVVCPTVDAAERVLIEDGRDIDAVITTTTVGVRSGIRFLEFVRDEFPQIARLLVNEKRATDTRTEIGLLAHDVIELPLEVMRFVGSVETAAALQRRINDPALIAKLNSIDTLPSPTRTVIELNHALSDESVSVSEIVPIVEADVAVTAKLLRVVNSAFFGLSSQISNTAQAIAYLGLSTVRNLVNSIELLNAFQTQDRELRQAVDDIQSHSHVVADLARGLMNSKIDAQDAYVAGLLHDVGLLALISCDATDYMALRQEVLLGERSLERCELDVIGATHASIGAYVLGLWGFPAWLIEAVGRSHDADDLTEWKLDVMSGVFVAEQLTNLRNSTPSWEGGRIPSDDYLETLELKEMFELDESSSELEAEIIAD